MKHFSLFGLIVFSAVLSSCSNSSSSNNSNTNNNTSGSYNASGSITVVVHCNNSAVLDQGNGYINTKNEIANSSLVMTCGTVSNDGVAKHFPGMMLL